MSGANGSKFEAVPLGDISVHLMLPQGMSEMPLTDASLIEFAGKFAYKGRTAQGFMVTRFIETTMGHAELTRVTAHTNLPAQLRQ